MLTENYEGELDFGAAVNAENKLDTIVYSYQEIEAIYVYTDNPTINNYKQYHLVTDEIAQEEWYQRAVGQSSAFWVSMERVVSSVSSYNLCLVRRMTLSDAEYNAVVVIKLSDQYIRSRIDSSVIDAVSVDDSGIVYSSKSSWYGEEQMIDIDYTNGYFSYSGTTLIDGTEYFTSLSTTHLYMTDSRLYVGTLSADGFDEIRRITEMCILILLLAIVIPGVIIVLFTQYFTGRVNLLRKEMNKASMQDYDIIPSFSGHDELTEAYGDLMVMVRAIQEKDAKMYEAELNEKELRNEQQIMEYKMLAGQINPHYLYNALETIRMKAVTGGDREVADAIKTLGKTMRYVLENTGTSFTSLKKELEHIENYLSIQKLRFGSRINYSMRFSDGLKPEEYRILPLLLQPVVENTVVHGLDAVEEGGQIGMEILLTDSENLTVTVSDNGHGMSEETLERIREKLNTPDLNLQTSIGLYNINQRIRLCYGEDYGMQIESREGEGTRVILHLPAMRGASAERLT